ncbi:nicotinate-nucleotide adenylyltransferase [Ornithinibacillus halotolerans]|uniref:Probable nicotinate-nucleotide adenylyltransferase n=1 Tax=Ornithinibacillus halotolerans TaxID=1274357 RepID=A0A916RT19_9BACI|nr:nicotinate-nucleotide adenylyltransferase [Ornithinibacillus halotolerans]GGA68891.1 putative nicotinate-nucleotide adenylyltransferase [Ornithinibacillus halotolerans]
MKRIGILGGTFDPPHIGHLIIAEEVNQALDLDEIWFIPTYEPPHKGRASVSVENRIEMLKLAIADNESFKLNTIEVDREGKSYTYDTMLLLTNKYPDSEFYFIIGADMVEYLPNWYKIDELMKLVTFIGVKRSGYSLNTTYPIREVEIPMVDISSSLIRKRQKEKGTIQYLVPKSVYTYIKEHSFYE